MILKELNLTNFRIYESITFFDFDRIAIFIGENDAGKTVLLDAIEVLVGTKPIAARDARRLGQNNVANNITVEGTFLIEEHDAVPNDCRSGENADQLRLSRRATMEDQAVSTKVIVRGIGFADNRFDNFSGADNQKNLLREYGINPGTNEPIRRQQLEVLIANGTLERIEKQLEIVPSQVNSLNQFLPKIERISSIDYRSPESLIQRTLQKIAGEIMSPLSGETGEPQELAELAEVRQRVRTRFNEEIGKITPILCDGHKKLQKVIVEPVIDFTKAVTSASVILDCGEGEQSFDSFGEGTKRRIWMGLLDWERQATAGIVNRSILRLYDEPDVNLHYEAQRQLFNNIYEAATDISQRTQCFVCTHSVTLIDRAPIRAINLITIPDDGLRVLTRISPSSQDDEIVNFFNDIGHAVGLSNTILLYERGFLVVEGDTEEQSVPIIYRNLYGKSMREDGLVLVNLHTCSAWRAILEVLLFNRIAMTHLLLDNDCQNPNSGANITGELLAELSLPDDFLNKQVTWIGTKEYEDAFNSELLADALNAEFPLQSGNPWDIETVENIKAGNAKFSEALTEEIFRNSVPQSRSKRHKPAVATAVARLCDAPAKAPSALVECLHRLRIKAGIIPAEVMEVIDTFDEPVTDMAPGAFAISNSGSQA